MRYVILLLLFYITSSSGFKTAGNQYGTCILDNGAVSCVGINYKGMLGIGDTDETTVHVTPQQVYSSGVTDLACTSMGACCVIKSNNIYCWGSGHKYQTGLNTNANKYSPEQVDTGYNMVQCGLDSCIARKTDNSLRGWGANGYRMLGQGNTDRTTPTYDWAYPQLLVSDYLVLSKGVVAIETNGDVWGWGYQTHCEHTNQWPSYEDNPKEFASSKKMSDCVSFIQSGNADQDTGYCKDSSGKVLSFGASPTSLHLHGSNTAYSRGNPQFMTYTTTKDASGQSTDWSDVKEIAVNSDTIYILTTGGKIYFGGDASNGYTATETISWSPIKSGVELDAWGSDNDHIGVAGEKGFIVKKANGTKWVIGNNNNGQLGDGDTFTDTDTTSPFSIKEFNPPPLCNENFYGNNGACTACASAYRNPAGDLESCTTCSCTKLPDCALNEYANGDGCTVCGANAVNKTVGDDPATVTTCTCPENYFGNNGDCTYCEPSSIGFVEITDSSAPTVAATKTQCEHYASITNSRTWQGDVSTALQSWQPKGCIVVQQATVFWNPSTTSLTLCDTNHICIDITTNTHVGTRPVGDDQSCTTCACDAPCGIGNYGDNYGCSLCAANTQAKAAGDLQSCTTCTCLCTTDHYGNNGSCTTCANGYENTAGDSQLCTTCACSAKPPCAVGQYGNGNGCTICPTNSTNAGGDSQDCTTCHCDCQENFFGDDGLCTACSTGYTRQAGDIPDCTTCACTTCDTDYYGDGTSCQQCPGYSNNAAGDASDCTDCACECNENYYGNFGVCTSCPTNSTNAAGDSHGCQTCTCACDENYYGVNSSCVACDNGYTNPAGDSPACQNCSCTPPPASPLPPTTPSTGTSMFVVHRFVVWVLGMVVLVII